MQDPNQRNMESFLENLKHQVQCPLCNETLIEPKLLQCFHTFCKSCIKRHAQLTEQVHIFKCPRCTSQTMLQELNDVEDLQISPVHSRIVQVLSFIEKQKICSVSASHSEALWHCPECNQSLCEECFRCHSKLLKTHQVISLSDLKKEEIEIMLKRESPCKTHDIQEVDLHCEDCDILICVLCWKTNHLNHKITSLQKSIDNEKDLLSKNLEEIDKMSTDENKKKRQEEIALLIKDQGGKAKEHVKKLTKELDKTLFEDEQQLLNELQKSITKADRNLRIIRHTTEAQEYINYFIQNGTASEMIDTRHGECSKNVTYKSFDKWIAGIEFKPNEELCKQVETGLGLVQQLNMANPKMCSIKVEPEIQTGYNAVLTVQLKTSDGDLVTDEALENVKITFTPIGNVQVGEIRMINNSHITVDFVPQYYGELTAAVQVHGNPVSNSPLILNCY